MTVPTGSLRASMLWHRYKPTGAEYDRMMERQDGRCAACRQEWDRPLHVDHDHDPGRVRGLLCAPCNQLAGFLESARMIHVLAYLRRVHTDKIKGWAWRHLEKINAS